ncbi:unnamed protein product [Polarella glacialis]|uniref:Uncharacterized protein n=1 Tax=Polarella glacialis TaxID=89957 RepID=A0A813JQA1_POLGL|nr:unnamed protein product [Polarella glacialis]
MRQAACAAEEVAHRDRDAAVERLKESEASQEAALAKLQADLAAQEAKQKAEAAAQKQQQQLQEQQQQLQELQLQQQKQQQQQQQQQQQEQQEDEQKAEAAKAASAAEKVVNEKEAFAMKLQESEARSSEVSEQLSKLKAESAAQETAQRAERAAAEEVSRTKEALVQTLQACELGKQDMEGQISKLRHAAKEAGQAGEAAAEKKNAKLKESEARSLRAHEQLAKLQADFTTQAEELAIASAKASRRGCPGPRQSWLAATALCLLLGLAWFCVLASAREATAAAPATRLAAVVNTSSIKKARGATAWKHTIAGVDLRHRNMNCEQALTAALPNETLPPKQAAADVLENITLGIGPAAENQTDSNTTWVNASSTSVDAEAAASNATWVNASWTWVGADAEASNTTWMNASWTWVDAEAEVSERTARRAGSPGSGQIPATPGLVVFIAGSANVAMWMVQKVVYG